ncbi:MAG: class I SAM-dependent methyltransferase [Chloroflexota bacterium]|nr:class I SAM-dependent methyltransferase [Chloroflexota bacterium]
MNIDRDEMLARYYALEYTEYREDLEFYIQYARLLDPDNARAILELGCGTGRVLLTLAQAGFCVTGIDISPAMLRHVAQTSEKSSLSARVTTVEADMRSPGEVPGAPFNMALCALNTFAYLTSADDQLAVLRSAHALITPGGLLVLDLTPPLSQLFTQGEVVYQGSYPDPATGSTLHKLVSSKVSSATQSEQVTIFYDLEAPDGTLTRATQSLLFRWTGRYEMHLLLEHAGYRVEQLYGDYELNEFDDSSPRMIFVARREAVER